MDWRLDPRRRRTVRVPAGDHRLEGELRLPPDARGVVLFAHGSGSSRHSVRNQFVARVLEQHGLGTLLIDLLTRQEELLDQATAELRFDIPLLARRVVSIIDWLGEQPATRMLPICLFGASTGAGAALLAAAERPARVAAIVSRGGRPDLAGSALHRVVAPTLLIVGGLDLQVIQLNRDAMREMQHEVTLEIVPGATHLFEEPGTLQQVAMLASEWFQHQVQAVATAGA
jgi:putative phosphoribosyl transferase